ncbi:MAG: hypothetical protein QOG07_2795, partial [Pseudonocardiales bacterium]|nr:hypothetical protein [Pseudonocardiales bacterium]
LTCVAVRGHGDDVEVGVGREQPQEFTSGVPAGAGDGDPISHVHDYALDRNFMQRQPEMTGDVLESETAADGSYDTV